MAVGALCFILDVNSLSAMSGARDTGRGKERRTGTGSERKGQDSATGAALGEGSKVKDRHMATTYTRRDIY